MGKLSKARKHAGETEPTGIDSSEQRKANLERQRELGHRFGHGRPAATIGSKPGRERRRKETGES